MGSWGMGLTANDTALDALADQRALTRLIGAKPEKVLKYLLKIHKEFGGERSADVAVLGVADMMLQIEAPGKKRPIELSASQDFLLAIVKRERKNIGNYTIPKERKEALGFFVKLLKMKTRKFPKATAIRYLWLNRGLLQVIGGPRTFKEFKKCFK